MKHIDKILQTSFLQNGLCSNPGCIMSNQAFSTKFSRCPVCLEPQCLPSIFTPTVKNKNERNIYQRFFSKSFTELFKNDLYLGKTIGNTSLEKNPVISSWAGVSNLYLKQEQENPSGSFKDRGTFTAAMLLKAKLKENNFILGTVSTGNMAISTTFISNLINNNSNKRITSFIVVSSKTQEKKIQAITHAAGKTGTTIFIVDGDYSLFHQKVYEACLLLQSKEKSAYAQLTDDVFRIIGYATLFGEIIEQLISTPDVIILPTASGALFRVAIWALKSFLREKSITKVPRVILVQESGGDPIVQAYKKNQKQILPIKLTENLIADGINVSYSRSGNPVLQLLQENYLDPINVSTEEINDAQKVLRKEKIYVEPASSASIAAAKKLKEQGKILAEEQIVCVLTGGEITHRTLGNGNNSNIIHSSINSFKDDFLHAFSRSKNLEESGFYYYA